MRVCFVASEVAPLAKTGGLADVSGVLPRHLHARGADVRVFLPRYSTIGAKAGQPRALEVAQRVPLHLGAHAYQFSIFETRLPDSDVPLYLVDCPEAFDRPTIYTQGGDEHLRFLILQRAALETCQRLAFAPDIVHCNDWHTGLIPLMLKTLYAWDRLFAGTKTVMSIHNIGYQGVFDRATVYDIGGEVQHLLAPDTQAGGPINWLREGIRHAGRVTTVSPTYAWEITTPLGGHGLDHDLRARPDGVVGILNGVDYTEWNPETDRFLQHRYSARDLAGKTLTKRALLERMNLPVAETTPLLGVVSRLVEQKGFDLLFDTLPEILATRDLAFIALGSGEARYEDFLAHLQHRFPDRVVFHRGYHEELSHLIEAASDMFLMPSQYEPCGLNQMYSLKYGTIPIVRRTGGLADSVQMWNGTTRQGTGIVFNDFDAHGLRWALHTALDLFKDRDAWRQMMQNAMAQDFSWERQTQSYIEMYRGLLG